MGGCGPRASFRRVPGDYGCVEGPGGRVGGFLVLATEAVAPSGASSEASRLCHPRSAHPRPFPSTELGTRRRPVSQQHAPLCVPEAALTASCHSPCLLSCQDTLKPGLGKPHPNSDAFKQLVGPPPSGGQSVQQLPVTGKLNTEQDFFKFYFITVKNNPHNIKFTISATFKDTVQSCGVHSRGCAKVSRARPPRHWGLCTH